MPDWATLDQWIERMSMGQGGHNHLQQDPAVMLELMLVAGDDMESIAASLLAAFGPDHTASALAMIAMTSPAEGVRGLTYLAAMGVGVNKLAIRLEAMNISPWSLITSERVPVPERMAIAHILGGDLMGAVAESGLRIVDKTMDWLDDGLVVDGSLALYRVQGLETTPDRLYVGKVLDLWDCANLKRIGTPTTVRRLMRIRDCNIEAWPADADIAELDMDGMSRGPFQRQSPKPKRRRVTRGGDGPGLRASL